MCPWLRHDVSAWLAGGVIPEMISPNLQRVSRFARHSALCCEVRYSRESVVDEMNNGEPRLVWLSATAANQLARGREMTKSVSQ